ncbi:transglutaminaseTgpA domain-containing protein [Bifidobacterium callitrichidarum]|nr:transglutaminaseTgpA domain-containing protein [Bifidobacterium callitrichidarum]
MIRHGLIRPTWGGLVLLAAACGCCFGGLLLDERTLMDVTIALAVVFVCALAAVILQWFGVIAIGGPKLTRQIEQRDSHGNTVARVTGELPERRGWYVTVSTVVRWKSPLGLIAARKVVPDDGQALVLPTTDEQGASGTSAVDKRHVGSSQSEHSGGVRAYAPGDPLKLISWRHTAHRGELMTRESSRDVRATALLVLNTGGVTGERLDAEVAALLPWARASQNAGRAERLIVTDGVQTFEGLDGVERFLAAVQPDAASAIPVASADATASTAPESGKHQTGREKEPDSGMPSASMRAAAIARTAMSGQGPVRVMVCDAADGQELAAALRRTPVADRLTVLDPAVQEPAAEPTYQRIVIQESSGVGRRIQTGADGAGRETDLVPAGGGVRSPRLTQRLLPDITGALALLAFFGVALKGLSGLIAPDGAWMWFAGALLGVAALEISAANAVGDCLNGAQRKPRGGKARPDRSRGASAAKPTVEPVSAPTSRATTHPVLRFAAYTVLTLVATAILAVVRFRVLAADALERIAEEEASQAAQQSAASGLVTGLASRWRVFTTMVEAGFDQLNLQLPPLKVSAYSDLFLILVVAALAAAIRLILAFRPLIPVMVALPVAALAADYALVGHLAPLWAIGLTVAALPFALAAARPRRLHPVLRLNGAAVAEQQTKQSRPNRLGAGAGSVTRGLARGRANGGTPAIALTATPLLAAALAVAITLPLTGPAAALAYRVPLSIGEGGGMFTSNTVNPMIDLKRNIAAGSDTTVLTYRAYKRLYLRLTTLDNFDGDTWGYDREFALDAGLYGSGIQLGRNSEDELSSYDRMIMNPLGAYMSALGYTGYDVATTNANTLEQFMVSANIRIDTLKSRFLPVPGNVTYMENGPGSDWLLYQDGTVYNRSNGTSSDLEYGVDGNAITPITSSSGFSQLSLITSAQDDLLGGSEVSDENRAAWYQARRDLAGTGLAEIRSDSMGDFLLIKATLNADGSVTGANGWRLGSGSFRGENLTFADGTSAAIPSNVVFNETVVNQLGLGRDGYVLGFGLGGNVAIVAPLDDSASETQDNLNSDDDEAISSFYGEGMWAGRAFAILQDSGMNLSAYTTVNGSISEAVPYAERMRRYVEASDKRAHKSRYTSLPKKLPDNVQAVIDQARAAGVPIKGSSYDDQVRAMRWLVDYFTNPNSKFTYSLDAPDGDGRDNLDVLDDFLDPENGHAGYCQHYASALAVLGRALGVPTRIVLGYNAGVGEREENGYFTVQSKQLHAWTEAYLDGVGWVPFDVTPATTENGSAASDADSSDTGDSSATTGDSGDNASDTTTQDQSGDESIDASGDTADQSDKSDSSDDAESQDAKADAGASSSGDGWMTWRIPDFTAWPMWARVLLGLLAVMVLAGLCWGVPRLWRWMRRRRVFAAIARAEARGSAAEPSGQAADRGKTSEYDDLAAEAWRMTWREVQLTARARARSKSKSGRRPSPNQTDMDIARILAEQCPEQADFILLAARNATAAAFHGTVDPVTGLPRKLKAFLK